ncbi:succinylglutamate desuccinylase/aspartoacylase family protein [Thalassotalea sp. G2M2-11]|uniref:succinylglutamate desuccinylase/aspartoacylase domain-containing protein n=1 Tax=Thalassotalea sp. G2M2-11 TaxID=2787627 RepID=UPI0019D30FCD|nr:succinylglutamate desuccinylase/aspartoacylase family protein [Thalassotalea sp. G2M2-11]
MNIDFNDIEYLTDPDEITLKADSQQFLLSLAVPTVIDIKGKQPDRCRVIITLLHGNEPSGLIAIHRWLTTEFPEGQPETNLRFIIASVEAANASPLLTHRYLDGGMDLNRCFGSSHDHEYYQRANLIEQAIRDVNPEAVIDLHNTSGSGPAFAVSPLISAESLTLTSFFCDFIILSNIKLGALMEQDFGCPTITIECGGTNDEQAHEVAFSGITKIAKCPCLSNCHQQKQVDVVYKPLRLKVKPHRSLSYSTHNEGYYGVTLTSRIEQFNFGGARQGQLLGWLDEHGLENLELINDVNENVIERYFTVRDSQLVCRTNMRIFMATTDKNIALSDCLFYIVQLPSAEPL